MITDSDPSGFYLWLGRATTFFYYGSIFFASLAAAVLLRYEVDVFFNIVLSVGYFAAMALSFFLASKSEETAERLNNRASKILFIVYLLLFFGLLFFGHVFWAYIWGN